MSSQSAILAPSSAHSRFLVLKEKGLDHEVLRAALGRLAVTRRRLQTQDGSAALVTALGFGPALWRELNGSEPAGLRELAPITGSFHMPASGGDLLLHINSQRLEDMDPDYIIRRSFLQFQNDIKLPKLLEEHNKKLSQF
mgnify:CR=1 FL=1